MSSPQRTELPPEATQVVLRILTTTDLHGHILPYDYYTNRSDLSFGLSRVASLVADLRAKWPDALLFDNGDFLQGTPLADRAMEFCQDRPNPVIKAMNLMGYDAATLGNHEFNFGLEALGRALSQSQFPFVSSNLKDHDLPCSPGLILRRSIADDTGTEHWLNIGVLGMLPPQITQWERGFPGQSLSVEDICSAATREAARLADLGADLVVALCHSGLGTLPCPEGAENAALAVAQCPDIDLVIAGHTHDRVTKPAEGTSAPILMSGCWGANLGVAEVRLTFTKGRWQTTDCALSLREVAKEATSDWPPLATCVVNDHEDTIAYAAQSVGESAVPLHTYFAVVGQSAAMQVIAEAQIAEVRANLDQQPQADLPVICAVAPFKAGGFGGPNHYTDIPAGPLSLRDIGNLYLYPNVVCALEVSGAELSLWLEHAAEQFRQITPGDQDATLLDPRFASHGFDILYGTTYAIDLTRPPMEGRVQDLRYQGGPIADTDRFVVVTNSYRVGGGGGYPVLDENRILYESTCQARAILQRHVASAPIAPKSLDQVFRFATCPDTTIAFETGTGATAYAAEARSLGLEQIGTNEAGFLRYRMRLASA